MTKTFKKITALAMAAVTAGAISASAYAEAINDFYFNIYGHGQYRYSDPVTKGSSDNHAAVNGEDGFVSETAFMYLSVHNYHGNPNDPDNPGYPGSAVTDTIKITKVDYYTLPYTAATAKAKNYCLKGQIGYYDAELSGTWAP